MPSSLITDHPLALRILMTEDLYLLDEAIEKLPVIPEAIAEPDKPTIEERKPVETPISFSYLGDNNKYILLLVDDKAHEFCSPQNLETLTNMLKAKQLEIKDIALVNLSRHAGANFKALKNYFACSKLVAFGIDPAQLDIKGIASNQITPFENVKVLATYRIDEMQADVAKKRTFWNEMKTL